jgi:hypothetical protein
MGWFKQESAYERRMRELEEEAERIRKNMQSLMKNSVRETSTRPAAPSTFRARSTVPPASSRSAAEPIELDDQSSADDTRSDEESFSSQSDFDAEREITIQETPTIPSEYSRRTPYMNKPERLANYLASGSFGKGGSLSRERRIQRNKAIFMMIVALIAVYSLYAWLK